MYGIGHMVLCTGPFVSPSIQNRAFRSLKFLEISQISKTNTRHVSTYLNALLLAIPNTVTKFQNILRFFLKMWEMFCRLLMLKCSTLSLNRTRYRIFTTPPSLCYRMLAALCRSSVVCSPYQSSTSSSKFIMNSFYYSCGLSESHRISIRFIP